MDRGPAVWTINALTPPFGEMGEIASLLLVAAVPTGPRRKLAAKFGALRLVSNHPTNPIEQGDTQDESIYCFDSPLRGQSPRLENHKQSKAKQTYLPRYSNNFQLFMPI